MNKLIFQNVQKYKHNISKIEFTHDLDDDNTWYSIFETFH